MSTPEDNIKAGPVNPTFEDALSSSVPFSLPPGAGQIGASLNNGSIGATTPPTASSRTVAPVCPPRRGQSSPMDTSGVNPQRLYSFKELSRVEVSCTAPSRCGTALIANNSPQHCPKCKGPVKVIRSMWRSVRWSFRQRALFESTNGERGLYVQPSGSTTVKGEWFLAAVHSARSNSRISQTHNSQSKQYRRKPLCRVRLQRSTVQG